MTRVQDDQQDPLRNRRVLTDLFGWLTMLFGNSLDLHVLHRLAMWVMVWFSIIHIYIAVREDILSRQTVISTMLSGERQFRD
jgi:Ni/Fe-hydrogenase 1 B-type cytochrome subunit